MYRNMQALYLENDLLRVAVLPEVGGKIASVYHKPQAFEAIFQPGSGSYSVPTYGAPFKNYGASGIDDCLPNIDLGRYPEAPFQGLELPDHGEVWSLPWAFQMEEEVLTGSVRGRCLPYTFVRKMELNQNELALKYTLRNDGTAPLRCLWTFHGLLACDEASEIHLAEVQKVVNVKESRHLGPPGTVHDFPLSRYEGHDVALNRIRPKTSCNREKYYVDPSERTGDASMTLNQNRLRLCLRFSPEELPYCGVWLNEGAFNNDLVAALEPSNGYYDSMEIACRNGTPEPIAPGEESEWTICIQLEEIP